MDAASKLKQWIKAKGYRRDFVAERLGVSYGALSKVLSGKLSPSLALAVRIEKLTGIKPADWVKKSPA